MRLSSRSFFQVNREVATRIYQDVVALAPASITRAVDVYAGAAGFALSLAGRSREVVAIEENPAAVQTAGRRCRSRMFYGGARSRKCSVKVAVKACPFPRVSPRGGRGRLGCGESCARR